MASGHCSELYGRYLLPTAKNLTFQTARVVSRKVNWPASTSTVQGPVHGIDTEDGRTYSRCSSGLHAQIGRGTYALREEAFFFSSHANQRSRKKGCNGDPRPLPCLGSNWPLPHPAPFPPPPKPCTTWYVCWPLGKLPRRLWERTWLSRLAFRIALPLSQGNKKTMSMVEDAWLQIRFCLLDLWHGDRSS
ncbi:hypothetical protein VTK26DRAFT_496 [Humicola hyalothermophila]